MFNNDVKMLARLEPVVRRVLIIDGNMAASRLLSELMRGMGARDVVFETDERHAMDVVRDFEPTLIFCERSGPRFDGEDLARRIRRSPLASRKVPIIMVTAEATATTIKGARDAGVHEFMLKPFTTGDLVRRVINIATKPRPWVEAIGYVGPDRRRFNSGEYRGPRKRQSEARAIAGASSEEMDQARKIIVAALDQFDTDPVQARRAITAQGETLKDLAIASGQSRLAVAAAELAVSAQVVDATLEILHGPATAVLTLIGEGMTNKAA